MTVAFVGAGNMGGALVERLCEADWPVTVCDVDPLRQQQALAAGASLADTPLSAVAQLGPHGALVVVVVDADQCREVLWGEQGAALGLQPGQAVVLCPTVAPEDSEAIARRLASQGIDCIDAPMSGGPQRARDGRMSLMVAAPPAVLERHADLLAALSLNVMRISERVGDGARTKLVNNLLAGINLVGAADRAAHGAGPDHHAGRDRALQRPELDRLGPHAPRDLRRPGAARPRDPAGKRHPAGGGGGAQRGV